MRSYFQEKIDWQVWIEFYLENSKASLKTPQVEMPPKDLRTSAFLLNPQTQGIFLDTPLPFS